MASDYPVHQLPRAGLGLRALDEAGDDQPQGFIVDRQELHLEVNFPERRLDGRTDIYITVLSDRLDEIAIDARQSEIDLANIYVESSRDGVFSGTPKQAAATYKDKSSLLEIPRSWNVTAEHHDVCRIRAQPIMRTRHTDLDADSRDAFGCTPNDSSLRISIRSTDEYGPPERPRFIIRTSTLGYETPSISSAHPRFYESGIQYKISISFKTKHARDGLQFVGVDEGDMRFPHVYTLHSIEPGTACCIFPCVDDYGCRSEWKISLIMPRTLGNAFNQALVTQQQANGPVASQSSVADVPRHYALEEKDKLREMTAVCSGILTDEVDDPNDSSKKIMTFEPEKRASAQKIGFAIGPFEHVDLWSTFRTEEDDEKLGANALKIHGFCLPNRAELVRNTCVALAAAADFLTLTFAQYPFENFKLCFVDDMAADAVPVQSLALVSNRVLFPEDVVDTEVDVTRILVHSLAVQWSGCNMIANTREDLWLVIGIAHFMTELFMKRLCGNNEYRFRMKTLSDKLVEVDVNRPSLHQLGKYLHLGDYEGEFMSLKAPLVLFMLDRRMVKASGSAGLAKALSKLLLKSNVSDSADSVINTNSFKRHCEKNGKYKLDTFWEQWIFGSGCPRFKVTQRFNKKRLCVEMSLKQVQDEEAARKRPIDKSDFMRLVTERLHDVEVGEIQNLFTGPMTIRIHEADGTPYEHIVEVREEASRFTRFEIPYNTKYKRLKRNRRQKERANAGPNGDVNGELGQEALLYCLGDVLQGQEDMAAWELHDWDADVERKMDQESYEWIRMDADFEWICRMSANLESYMYVSQLQQDRDVVAQQDSMVFLSTSPRHPLVSTILTRTLIDRRYFYGIRTLAAEVLPRHANIDGLPLLGFRHLVKAYRELFCLPGSHMPRPNDFSDKQQYAVQCAIIQAIAKVRDSRGRCPDDGVQFILDQLLYNNNEENMYSDHHFVALLLRALATALIPDETAVAKHSMSMEFDDGEEEEEEEMAEEARDDKDKGILMAALELIDRYRRRDEWELSYQNVWTVAALDSKQRLMKAGVIAIKGQDFVQYLQDDTHDLIRIKAFEALVDLGLFLEPPIFRLIICVMATDRSPFVRQGIMKALGEGIAALALGEHFNADETPGASELVVLDSDQTIVAKKATIARRENLEDALAALKRDMSSRFAHRAELQRALRTAMDSTALSRTEHWTLLEMCSILFDEADNFLVTLQYPKKWRVSRPPASDRQQQCLVTFSSLYRTHPEGYEDLRRLAASEARLSASLSVAPQPAADMAANGIFHLLSPPSPSSFIALHSPPLSPAPPPPARPARPSSKRPVIVAKNSAIKITKASQPPAFSLGVLPALNPNAVKAELAAASKAPARSPQAAAVPARVPLPLSCPTGSSDTTPSALPHARSANGPPPPSKTPKRARPEKGSDATTLQSPAAKKFKLDPRPSPAAAASDDGPAQPPTKIRRMITLRHKDLASILASQKPAASRPTPTTATPADERTPAGAPAASVALGAAAAAKPARKPLPDSAPAPSRIKIKLKKPSQPSPKPALQTAGGDERA